MAEISKTKQMAIDLVATGMTMLTISGLTRKYKEIGYRFDRSNDAKCVARWASGEFNGRTYNCCTLDPVEIDTGVGAFNIAARRDANYEALKELRSDFFAFHKDTIYEV